MTKTRLTDNEKRAFYWDGFVVLEDIVPEELVVAAQQRYQIAKPGDDLMKS
mgnify:CR=1 FL=1